MLLLPGVDTAARYVSRAASSSDLRYVIKGGPMDPGVYDAHADTMRQSTFEAQISITATYRLFFRLLGVELRLIHHTSRVLFCRRRSCKLVVTL